MLPTNATFLKSSTLIEQCPAPDKPEFAFIGRSNVGKSSLINMLMRLLFPTLLRPMKANSGLSGAGHCSMRVDDLRNVALVGSIFLGTGD